MHATTMQAAARRARAGGVIDSARHPLARRVRDVLRAPASARRSILIDDEGNIAQALRCGVWLDSLYLTLGTSPATIVEAAMPHVPAYRLTDAVATELFGVEKRSRIFALARRPRLPSLVDMAARSGDVVVLDGVRLAGNIGAITRTAAAFGAAGLVLLDSGLASPFDRRLIRASRGLVFSLPVVPATGPDLAGWLRREDVPVAALAADAPMPLRAIRAISGRIAILLGSEGAGASAQMLRLADHRFAIAMPGGVESLNVSVAAGIALHERAGAAFGGTAG